MINFGTYEAVENGVEGFKTLLDCGNFDELYATSIRNPKYFWGTLAKQFLQWDKLFEKVMDCNMEKGDIKWFTQGKLNISGELATDNSHVPPLVSRLGT